MRISPFIFILPFLWWAFNVKAQVPQEPSSSSMPEQWQLTLDTIKSKAQSLVIENNGLQAQYRKLIEETQKLQQSVDEQQSKNEQMEHFLKDRHGRTDQQVRIEELTQMIKTKRKQLKLARKVRPQEDDQLPQLRKQIEDEITQEVLLENELKGKDTKQ